MGGDPAKDAEFMTGMANDESGGFVHAPGAIDIYTRLVKFSLTLAKPAG